MKEIDSGDPPDTDFEIVESDRTETFDPDEPFVKPVIEESEVVFVDDDWPVTALVGKFVLLLWRLKLFNNLVNGVFSFAVDCIIKSVSVPVVPVIRDTVK